MPPEYQPEPEPTAELSPQFRRAVIDYPTVEPPRTIIIDTPNTYLYLTIDHSMQFATASVLAVGGVAIAAEALKDRCGNFDSDYAS